MAVALFRFKPAHTLWVGVEIIVTYSCRENPKVERVRISGLKQFGLIVSHEYDIDVLVDTARREPCDAGRDCREGTAYEFTVKVFVSDVIGLGIGIGKLGTGTAGWTTKPTEQTRTFRTNCLCCDSERTVEIPTITVVNLIPAPNATPWFVGFATIGAALTLATLNLDQPSIVPRLVVYGTGLGILASLGIAVARMAYFFRRVVPTTRDRGVR